MDFAPLPPEINSARMYAGPGPGPMLAAAAAWDGLAAELNWAAAAYGSVVSDLTSESWLGPSSGSMAAAATRYVAWLTTTAANAEKTATQAKAAASAYETAFAETVPPPVIAANRALLMTLVSTNILGQNTPAITATEALYGEMWAQDAAAMYGYAGAAASASMLTPFDPPQPITNPAGSATQSAALAQTTGTSAGAATQTALSPLTTAVPGALQGPAGTLQAAPAVTLAPQAPAVQAISDVVGLSPVAGALSATGLSLSGGAFGAAQYAGREADAARGELAAGQQDILNAIGESRPMGPLAADLASADSGGLGAGGRAVTAGMGQAASSGALSVPQGWATATPAIRPATMALPVTSVGAAPAVLAGTSGTAFSEMALAGMAGRALAGTVSPGYRERVGATTRERAESPQRSSPGGPPTGIAAELREFAELRDAGIISDAEFNGQKRLLLDH